MATIKHPEIDKLHQKIYPSIKDIHNNYFFLNLSKEEFNILIENMLTEIYNKEDTTLDKDIYIKKLKKQLDIYTKNQLKDEKNFIEIINRIINKN